MAEPHEDPRFSNAVEHTVAITYTVRGGRRHGTADRQARKIAERLATHAARMSGVVAVQAVAGPSRDGQMSAPRTVRFDGANSGTAVYGEPHQLDRYLDPDHELALRSLASANTAAAQRRHDDHKRRLAAGCRNAYQPTNDDRLCDCVYCQPDLHHEAVVADPADDPHSLVEHRCVCGQRVAAAGQRCLLHRRTTVVVLPGDPPTLRLLADTPHP